MQNPFTTTFSKIPANTYIPTEQEQEIIENFSYDEPSESVYKITGVRGSGKTVLLAKVEEEFASDDNRKKGWCVYRLSPSRDMLMQLASYMDKEGLVKRKKNSKSVNISASVLGSGGGIGLSTTNNNDIFDIGIEIDNMLQEFQKKDKRILVGVDEVSKTPEMIVFASEFGKWIRAGYPIYLVCTGLYENIEQLYNVNNLTFFRRATTIKTEPLNEVRMVNTYRKNLDVDMELAKEMASDTKGYPYAFQQMGVLYFKKSESEDYMDVIFDLKTELYAYSYEKIWEELTIEDRALVSILSNDDELKREDILNKMEKPNNYSVYRDRLLKRGIIKSRQGYISLALPYFGEYIKEYHSEG